jgi:hypothetical protein
MLKNLTRAKVVQIWFAAIALIVAAGIAWGAAITIGTGAMLAALCLVPPVILLVLWPAVEPSTVAELLHDAETRQ